jgi:hypothetical protein
MFWDIMGYISGAFVFCFGTYLIFSGKLKFPTRIEQSSKEKAECCEKAYICPDFIPCNVIKHQRNKERQPGKCPPSDVSEIRQDNKGTKNDEFAREFPEVEVHVCILSHTKGRNNQKRTLPIK